MQLLDGVYFEKPEENLPMLPTQRVFNLPNFDNNGRCQDTMIGGSFVRGVSGGERKRVSIGNEIIINPSLLLLDEPTSGLDSTTALRIMQVLRDIAEVSTAYVFIYLCGS